MKLDKRFEQMGLSGAVGASGTRACFRFGLRPELALGVLIAFSALAHAEDPKVSRVALFNSGVGYFQADGTVDGDASSDLRFRTGQINDIIKSLVLQDLDGGTISAVQYPSRDPIEKTLKSFGVDITGKPTLGQLLDQLRGVEVEIGAPTAGKGLILGVEKQRMEVEKGKVVETEVLTLLTDGGMRTFKLNEVGGIKINDPKIESELKKALLTLASAHDADKKTVTLNFAGKGKRRVRVGYMLEAPIWKTSYRLVLADGKKPYLQGWATVENTTEEDWKDVALSLVSGRPISFIMDLYTPIYVPRPTEELELYASLRPPTYEGGVPAEAAEMADTRAKRGTYAFSQNKPAAPRAATGIAGRGATNRETAALAFNDSSVESVATAEKAGELFAYDIKTPVSLKRQQSAMLPIVTAEIEGEKLSIYNPATHVKYPLNGIEITNTTDLNLMQGPVTVFDGSTYAGDAKIPDLRPKEKRLMAYALDLAVEVTQTPQTQPEELVSLRIAKGTLIFKRKYVDSRTYTLKNKDSKARTVIIEQPVFGEWTLIEPKDVYERAGQLYRFKVNVPANATATQKVVLERTADEGIAMSSMGLDTIDFYVRSRVSSPALKKALSELVAKRVAMDSAQRKLSEIESQISTIDSEQTRLRENIKALPPGSDIVRRYLTKLDSQETEIEKLRSEAKVARAEVEAKRHAVEAFLLELSVE